MMDLDYKGEPVLTVDVPSEACEASREVPFSNDDKPEDDPTQP
jgi:hypothetical protein